MATHFVFKSTKLCNCRKWPVKATVCFPGYFYPLNARTMSRRNWKPMTDESEPDYTPEQLANIREGLGPNPTDDGVRAHLDKEYDEATHPRNGRWGITEKAEDAGVHLMFKSIIGIIGDDIEA